MSSEKDLVKLFSLILVSSLSFAAKRDSNIYGWTLLPGETKPAAVRAKPSIWDVPELEEMLMPEKKPSRVPTASQRIYSALDMDPKTGDSLLNGEPLIDTRTDILTDPDLNYVPKRSKDTTSEFERIEEEMLKLEQEHLIAVREIEQEMEEANRKKRRKLRRRLRRIKRRRNPGWVSEGQKNQHEELNRSP